MLDKRWIIKTWTLPVLARSMTIPPLRRIYLSSRLSQQQKEFVLAHELEHAKRSEQFGVYLWTLAYIGGPALALIAIALAVLSELSTISSLSLLSLLAVVAWFPSMWFRVVEERHGEIAEAKARLRDMGAFVVRAGYIDHPWVYLIFLTKKQRAAEYKKIEDSALT